MDTNPPRPSEKQECAEHVFEDVLGCYIDNLCLTCHTLSPQSSPEAVVTGHLSDTWLPSLAPARRPPQAN